METKYEDYLDTTPDTQYYGPKKTRIVNFRTICRNLNRPDDHVRTFLMSELCAPSIVTDDGCLVIRGRHNSHKIYSIINQYIDQYVKCKQCKSYNSKLVKEARLYTCACSMCGHRKVLPHIRSYCP